MFGQSNPSRLLQSRDQWFGVWNNLLIPMEASAKIRSMYFSVENEHPSYITVVIPSLCTQKR